MQNSSDYLTRIGQDWPHSNQLHLQLFIRYAYQAVFDLVYSPNRNVIFNTPNRGWLAGINRFGAVDYFLERACEMQALTGIQPIWTPLTDGENVISVLELRGKHTSLVAHHLHFPEDTPRGSTFRDDKRLLNQQNPALPGFDVADSPSPEVLPINLTLVHGGKAAEFAFIRVYRDVHEPSRYVPISNNIMLLAAEDSGGAEEIQEAEIKLKEHLRKLRKQQGLE